ncbi:MAG TPA: S53 family peptidase [Candidatus Micrarchaeaceae archaeon]|nr:S53 family peptidase [Candidatus Micrarchaeaceae archaeon]
MRAQSLLAAAAICGVALVACGPARTATSPPAASLATSAGPALAASPTTPLPMAIRQAVSLGPAGAGTQVYLNLGLRVRNPQRLAALLAAGRTVTPTEYTSEFGPDPALAAAAVALLTERGFHVTWSPSSGLIAADGPAPAAATLLDVTIGNYRLADGTIFYASLDQPRIPAPLAPIVTSVTGLDSYTKALSHAVRAGGLTPTDVLAFYNLQPLRDAGLDGAGQTVVLPEIDNLPNLSDLDKFATKFGLPPFEPLLTIKRDPSWGTPERPAGETVMDLEIIHEVAPKAKLVIYLAGPQVALADRAFDQLVTDHLGSIISDSLGQCEAGVGSGHRNDYASIEDRAVVQGMGHFVASGDFGAYDCGEANGPSVDFPSALPNITAVGGTTAFQSIDGKYFKEMAWISPIDQRGTGGGASQYYARPDYQKSVAQAAGNGMRQVPDVASDADPASGFSFIFEGRAGQAGGTSAAAPLWAGTMALINQDLKKKGLREAGFANPALYWMGQNSAKLPAPPFHDVVSGNNLASDAGPGWDFATGWGSMDAAALDQAWVLYIKGGGA